MDTISRGKTSRSYTFLPRARARRYRLVANHHRLPFLSFDHRSQITTLYTLSTEGRRRRKKRDGNIETVDNRENEGVGGEGGGEAKLKEEGEEREREREG